MPLIPGKPTSSMRQSGLRGGAEFKNSSAEANTFTFRRTDLISLSSDLRTETSSSTTATRGAILMLLFLHTKGEEIYYTFVVVYVRADYLCERIPRFCAILTRSAKESAHIFCMTCPR